MGGRHGLPCVAHTPLKAPAYIFADSKGMRMQDAYTARTSAQLLLEALVSSGGGCEAALQAAVHAAFERAAAAKARGWRILASSTVLGTAAKRPADRCQANLSTVTIEICMPKLIDILTKF